MNKLILKSTEINSTSIIPNFGAIMKMGKTFMYNEFLKYDDGKLAKFIAEEKGIDESVAKEEIKSWVESLNKDLEAGKMVVFDGVGELTKVDGKLKFTAKTGATNDTPLMEKVVERPKEVKPIIEKEEKPTEEIKPEKEVKKEVPKLEQSLDLKAKEVVEKIEKYSDKTELINFTRGDSRKSVIAALNEKLDELNGKKKAVAKEEPKPTEVIPPKNVVTEVKVEPKAEIQKPVVEEPKEIKPVVIPVKKEEKPIESVTEDKQKLKKETIEKPAEEKKKEEVKPSIKEKAAALEKPNTDKSEEEAAIAAIVGGVEKSEKETKKRKKTWILWVSLLLILIGGGTVGYLKKDMILGWFDKKHEPKDLAENSEEDNGHENSDDHSAGENDHDTGEIVVPEDSNNVETIENVEDNTEQVVDPVKEEVVEEPIVKEPDVAEPVVNSSSEGSWHIVAGSYSSQENAENKVEKLKSMGYSSAKVLGKYNGLYTVRVSSYNSKEEAKSGLESYKSSGNSGIIKKL